MSSDECMPTDVCLTDEGLGAIEAQFEAIFERVQRLARFNKAYLDRCKQEDDEFDALVERAEQAGDDVGQLPTTFVSAPREQRTLRKLFDAWLEWMATRMETCREVHHHTLSNTEVFGLDRDGYHRKLRTTLGMHVFAELSRLHLLLHRGQLLLERDRIECCADAAGVERMLDDGGETILSLVALARTRDDVWVSIRNTFDIRELYEKKEPPDVTAERLRTQLDEMWVHPVLMYRQSQTRALAMFLSQLLNEVPATNDRFMKEFRDVFTALWLRIAELTNEQWEDDVLDEPDMRTTQVKTRGGVQLYWQNRSYAVFCFFYMSEIARRFFQYDLLRRNLLMLPRDLNLPTLGEQIRNWVLWFVRSFPDSAFETVMRRLRDTGYTFVGDDGWFRFSRPHETHSRQAVISALRRHLDKRFYSTRQLTKEAVINAAKSSHLSRLFVFSVVDEYIKREVPNTSWETSVVVPNDGIEMAAYFLTDFRILPNLVQVFSSFWPYYDGRVYPCDDVFQAVGIWFILLRDHYNCEMLGKDCRTVVRHVLSRDYATILRQQDVANEREAQRLAEREQRTAARKAARKAKKTGEAMEDDDDDDDDGDDDQVLAAAAARRRLATDVMQEGDGGATFREIE